MNKVFVLDDLKQPLMPCSPCRARRLLNGKKAAVFRRIPFTIILNYEVEANNQPVEYKVDPGSKTTGLALIGVFPRGRELLWGGNLTHRGQEIVDGLTRRRSLRSGRRNRKTRYRQPRYLNRVKSKNKGWLPPSAWSRVDNISWWFYRLSKWCPITDIHYEKVRFDMQKMMNPEVSGVEYQQGELFGYEVKEYLLLKFKHQCVYCGVKNVPLEVEHIVPKSKGGSNRVSNLTLACRPCNQKKGNKPVEEFVKDKAKLKKIMASVKTSLKDAAAVNSTRNAIGVALSAFGLPTGDWTGGQTKFNRVSQGYPKDHFIDAACVGETGENVYIQDGFKPLNIKATGRGTRQVVRVNKYGFPRTKAGRVKRVHGFQTGDLVRLVQPRGKYKGTYVARLTSIRARGQFDIITPLGKVTANYKNFILLQRGDGYAYG